MKSLHNIIRLFTLSFRKELWDIATSPTSIMLVVGGMVAYGLLYNLLYHPNIVRKAPIVAVDNSHTHLSRHFMNLIDASPNAEIVAVAADLGEARYLLSRGKAVAILYLPNNLSKRIGRGEQAPFVILSSTATFLYYEATVEAVEEAMLALGDDFFSTCGLQFPNLSIQVLTLFFSQAAACVSVFLAHFSILLSVKTPLAFSLQILRFSAGFSAVFRWTFSVVNM